MKQLVQILMCVAFCWLTACSGVPQAMPEDQPKPLDPSVTADEIESKFLQIWGAGDPYSTDEAELAKCARLAKTQIFGRLKSRSVLPPPVEVKGSSRLARFQVIGLHIEIESISGERLGTRLVRRMVRTQDGSSRLQSVKESGELRVGDTAIVYVRYIRKELEPAPVERFTEGDWFWGSFVNLPRHDSVPYLEPAPGEGDIVPTIWTNAKWALERSEKMRQ